MKKILPLALALTLTASLCAPVSAATASFDDVQGSAWYYTYVMNAAYKGLVNGIGGGKFAPENHVTYAEFATMLDNIAWQAEVSSQQEGFTASGCEWWEVYCCVAAEHGLFDGTEIGNDPLGWGDSPNQSVSRADMAMMAYNFLCANEKGNIDDVSMAIAKSRIDDISHLDETHKNAIVLSFSTVDY